MAVRIRLKRWPRKVDEAETLIGSRIPRIGGAATVF